MTRKELLSSIAETIADYREGDVPRPSSAHIEKWVNQFDSAVQDPLLAEVDYILDHTYISRATFEGFTQKLCVNEKLVGKDPKAFWQGVRFLQIQGGGNSQREMLQMFDVVLQQQCGIRIEQCGGNGDTFLYLDDATFTGMRVRNDLIAWVKDRAPLKSNLVVVNIAYHSGGQYYARKGILEAAEAAGKTVKISWWRALEIEDGPRRIDVSDVLRPTSIPNDKLVKDYVELMKYKPTLRAPGSVGGNKFFSSDPARQLVEQEFLKAGAKIRSICPNLKVYARPLGNMVLETLGFGSMLVTFRNCPNNAPLALWAGDPWYPLFPRSSNSDAWLKRMLQSLGAKKATT